MSGRFDVLEALLGLGLMTTGAALVYLPAAFLLSGAVIFWLALWPPRARRG